jgi:hypothetical protein
MPMFSIPRSSAYTIVVGKLADLDEFEKKVQDQGGKSGEWEPVGGPVINGEDIYQAMHVIEYEEYEVQPK